MAKKKTAKTADEREENLSFEAAVGQLQEIVQALESGEFGLDESLSRFEEGMKLIGHCRRKLEAAEGRITLLTGRDAEGELVEEPFDDSSTYQESAPTAGRRKRGGSADDGGGDEGKAAHRELF